MCEPHSGVVGVYCDLVGVYRNDKCQHIEDRHEHGEEVDLEKVEVELPIKQQLDECSPDEEVDADDYYLPLYFVDLVTIASQRHQKLHLPKQSHVEECHHNRKGQHHNGVEQVVVHEWVAIRVLLELTK